MENKTSRQNKRIPIVVVGDAVAATGFARVLHSVLSRIKDRFEIHHIGINYFGDPHDYDWKLYVAGLGGDVYGVNRLEPLIEAVKPKIIFLIDDLWILTRYMPVLRKYAGSVKSIMYIPVDGEPLDPALMKELGSVDRLVVYNEFGERVVRETIAAAKSEYDDFDPPKVEIIPHGVDTAHFYPLGKSMDPDDLARGRNEAKRILFPDKPDFQDSFVVLNANRNQPRKRIDITMKGFAQFASGKPANVKLYLHMGTEDVGWNIISLAKRYGIENRLIISSAGTGVPTDTTARLNLIYNACEVGINTSIGEGWGLVSFEHAATGAAQIVPRHSACEVLWNGAAEFLEPKYFLTIERVLTEGGIVSPDDVAGVLEKLYQDPDHLRKMSLLAYKNATLPQRDWDVIAREWEVLLGELANGSQS